MLKNVVAYYLPEGLPITDEMVVNAMSVKPKAQQIETLGFTPLNSTTGAISNIGTGVTCVNLLKWQNGWTLQTWKSLKRI